MSGHQAPLSHASLLCFETNILVTQESNGVLLSRCLPLFLSLFSAVSSPALACDADITEGIAIEGAHYTEPSVFLVGHLVYSRSSFFYA